MNSFHYRLEIAEATVSSLPENTFLAAILPLRDVHIFRIWNTSSISPTNIRYSNGRYGLRTDDYNIQLTIRNLKPRIKAALD